MTAIRSGIAGKPMNAGQPQVGQKPWRFSVPPSPVEDQWLTGPVTVSAGPAAKTSQAE